MNPAHAPPPHGVAEDNRDVPPFTDTAECTVRTFYEYVLGALLVDSGESAQVDDALHFLLEGQLIRVSASGDDTPHPVKLTVASPALLAERCWDAGYTVHVEGGGVDETVYVTDPHGRTITLIPSARPND